ncbi:MAG: alginate export family protein, partial [Deltaproteobacteria bacterium]|nr:alginate export family protein [Deltaproteobacteria bacterium]
FDLHQAYVRVLPIDQIEMRLGRQEIFFENHRLIGTVGWLEQARSFDALRGIIKPDEMISIDVFYARTGEDHAMTLLADGSRAHIDDKDVIAANVHLAPMKELEAGLTFMVDIDANDVVQKRKYTAGGIVTGKTDIGLSYGAEGYYQFGGADNDPAAGRDVTYSAWLVAARAQMDIDVTTKPFVGAFGDFLSGDSDPVDGTFRTFDVPYATNHKFYGEMDFFLNSVAHTGQRGLADLGGVVGFKPIEGGVAKITYHHFKAMAGRNGEVDASGGETELDTFGNEVDLKLSYSPWKPLTFDWMYGFFVPGDIKRCMPGATGACTTPETKAEHFVYSTVSAKF